jgi:hypothetical protein
MKVNDKRGSAIISALLGAMLVGLVAAATALASPPQTTSPPTLEGGPFRQGITIRTGNGLWVNNPTSYTYRWLRCDAAGNNCTNIAGATSASYRLAQADVGRTVLSRVTARNADGSATANSRPSPVIADNVVPANTKEPAAVGAAVVGETLSADEGFWSGAPDRYAYQWRQCDAAGATCVAIPGATGKTYGVRSADLGRTLRVEVTAVNPRGRSTSTSNATAVVRAAGSGSGGNSGTAVPISSVSLPDRLVTSAVSFSPTAIHSRNEVVTLRVRVSDTRNRLVQGALVYATGVPFGRITEMPEVATGSNGIATLQFRPTTRLAIRRGAVQIFLRIRKPGDDVLAGVSSRRLVQITIQP